MNEAGEQSNIVVAVVVLVVSHKMFSRDFTFLRGKCLKQSVRYLDV